MNMKKDRKSIPSDSIVKNLLYIIGCGILLIVLTLLFLNIYTRHGQKEEIPSLKGMQAEEADKILKSKGLHAEIVDSVYQRDAVPGAILDQKPKAGNRVKKGRAIYITIYAKNPKQVAIPELVDYSTRQALALLHSMGFKEITIEEVPSEYSGLVLSVEYLGKQLLADEKIPVGAPLTLVVTTGLSVDSLEMDSESLVSPGAADGIGSTPPVEKGKIDDSFF